MPGFLIKNTLDKKKLKDMYQEACVYETMECQDYFVQRNTLNKFMNDKLFLEDDDVLIITEGVVLNKIKLMKKYQQDSFFMTVKAMAEEKETFFEEFRGSFSGAFYNKKTGRWLVYTNHIGDKSVFYYQVEKDILIGSEIHYLLDVIKENTQALSLDTQAVYNMLSFGFMEADETYACEIKRLQAGHYIAIQNGSLEVKQYHQFNNNTYDLKNTPQTDLIEELDKRFRAAVALEYDKDREYGYRHLADLSGGLDSRMNVWVAKDMGYSSIVNTTFSQSNYADEMIAKQIAAYLKNEIIVKPLDDMSFMKDIDDIVFMNGGLSLYSGITGGNRLLKVINMEQFGLEHTGQVGDAIVGSFFHRIEDIGKMNISGMYSERLKGLASNKRKNEFDNNELYLLYTRGFQGALSTHSIRQNYTEVASPFLDVDFLAYCYSIPPEKRIGHQLYFEWILTKYPKAAQFDWEKSGGKITDSRMKVRIRSWKKYGPDIIRRKLHLPVHHKNNNMNPMEYWYMTTPLLRKFMQDYVDNNIEQPILNSDIKNQFVNYFNDSTTIEKTQLMTVLSAMRMYFS